MMNAMLFAMLLQPDSADPESRHWPIEDPRVQFEVSPIPRGRVVNLSSMAETPMPQEPFVLELTCDVGEAGALLRCRVVHEEPRRAFDRRAVLRAAHAGRLRLAEDGPKAGDTIGLTLGATVSRVRSGPGHERTE